MFDTNTVAIFGFDPQTSQQREKAARCIRNFQQLRGYRGTWEQHWQEISQYMMPGHSHTFNALSIRTPGQKHMQHVFDSTAIIASKRFAAIMDSLLTPRSQMWHQLEAEDPIVNADRLSRLWLEKVNEILFQYRYAPEANFPSQNQQSYLSMGLYGTGSMFIDQLAKGKGIRYKNIHLGETYFRENHQGMVDSCYRYFQMTARQALQKWPKTVPSALRIAADKYPDQLVNLLHVVEPREDWEPGRLDANGMPWCSYYVSMQGDALLSEGGYRVFPYAVGRYEQMPGEVYGRCPGMDCLPAVKMLNEEKKITIKQGHRITDPPMFVPDDGVVSISFKPGSINGGGVTADGKMLVHTLPTGNLAVTRELMEDERNLINDTFLVTLFKILVESPEMTATEVLERAKEKGILLAPTIGRQQSEYLGPILARELDLLAAQGLLPPPPPLIVQSGRYHVKYTSPLNRDQMAEEAAAFERSIQGAVELSTNLGRPELLDPFNLDLALTETSAIRGMPARWLNDADTIAATRDNRAQQQQQAQAMQAAPGAAALISSAAKAHTAQGGGPIGGQGAGQGGGR